jgi:hypothetical protein
MPMEQLKLLEQWHHGLRVEHKSHVQAAAKCERNGRWLSIAALVASTIVGTSLLADANSSLSRSWKIGAGVLSLIAAVLSALQGSLKLGEQATLHRAAMQRYGTLRREVEELISEANTDGKITLDIMRDLRKRWDEIDGESPIVPQKLYDAVSASLQAPAPRIAARE